MEEAMPTQPDPRDAIGAFVELELKIYRSVYEGIVADLRLPWGELLSQRLEDPPIVYLSEAARSSASVWAGTGQLNASPDYVPARKAAEQINPVAYYGDTLAEWLFQGKMSEGFRQARLLAGNGPQGRGIRVRVGFGAGAESLLSLRWECLYDKFARKFLALDGGVHRFCSDFPVVWPEIGWPLQMFTVCLSSAAVSTESSNRFAEAVATLGDPTNGLVVQNRRAVVSDLKWLGKTLAEVGPFHGLALWCSTVRDDETLAVQLDTKLVPWRDVAAVLTSAPISVPGLVFLMAPALGEPDTLPPLVIQVPPLLEGGVRAVVATLSDLPTEACLQFTRTFFQEMAASGQIDRAVIAGRRALATKGQDRWDWVAPVLFTLAPDARWFQPISGTLRENLRGFAAVTEAEQSRETSKGASASVEVAPPSSGETPSRK
jgi:hypothetical protein